MKENKRMAGSYEIVHAIHIGNKEIVYGENLKEPNGLFYFVGNYTANELFSSYDENQVSDNFLEIMQEFNNRLKMQIEAVKAEQNKVIIPLETFTVSQCYPNDLTKSIEGKVMALRPDVLRNEYRTADRQVWLVLGGFGAQANSRGSACFSINLYSGKESRWERRDFMGEIKSECLPEWVKDRLAVVQKEQLAKSKKSVSKEER